MTNKMWGGRFSSAPAEIMEEINASIDFDRRLYAHDIRGSIAHCKMLGETGIISAEDSNKIIQGLNKILSEIEDGSFEFSRSLEDIHMNIESRLMELIGPVAGKLHTARSRNDQVATDFRLFVRETIEEIRRNCPGLLLAIRLVAYDASFPAALGAGESVAFDGVAGTYGNIQNAAGTCARRDRRNWPG